MYDCMKLRTDGIYVQFGYRPWSSWLGYTHDCWYNMFKVIDDNHMILLGQFNKNPFFEIKEETHKQIVRKFCLSNDRYSGYKIHINKEEQNSYDKIDIEKINSLLIDKQTVKMNLSDYFNTVSTNSNYTQPMFMSIYSKDDYYKKQFIDADTKCSELNYSFPSVINYDNVNDFEVIKDMYSYLNLEYSKDDFDVINIVKKLEKFDWNTLDNKICITGIDYITNKYCGDKSYDKETCDKEIYNKETCNDMNKELKFDDFNLIVPKNISVCSFNECNDHFNIVTYSNDVNSFYIRGSHCWVEGEVMCGSDEHWKYGDEDTNSDQIPFKLLTNSFKFTFIPFDLSEKSIWIDEYIKWKERYDYHKYYKNKNELNEKLYSNDI